MFILINGGAILLASILGTFLGKRLDPSIRTNSMPVFAAITFCIGIGLIAKGGNAAVATLAILLGFLIGEGLKLDLRLEQLSNKTGALLFHRSRTAPSQSTPLFISAFMLTVCSTAGLLGAVTLRLTGDYSILLTKALLDFMLILFYSVAAGPVLGILCIPVCLVLGLIYGGTGLLSSGLSAQMLLDFGMCGGMIQLVNGVKMISSQKVHVASLIPSIPLVFVFSWLSTIFG